MAGGNGAGSTADKLSSPWGIFVHNNASYIVDRGNHRVQQWDFGETIRSRIEHSLPCCAHVQVQVWVLQWQAIQAMQVRGPTNSAVQPPSHSISSATCMSWMPATAVYKNGGPEALTVSR